ncbi:MAG: sialidase family protein [Ruminiclostridium sp.]
MFAEVKKELVFEKNKYFASCHASTVTFLGNGDIMVAWFAGSAEGADDVAIWGAYRNNGTWSIPKKLVDDIGQPNWNPVLYTSEDGTIMLFYKVGRSISNWVTKVIISEDNAKTWSDPEELVSGDTSGGRGPVRNKVIKVSNGDILAPTSTENGIWKCMVDIYNDSGKTWTKSNEIQIENLDYENMQSVKSNIAVSEQSFKGKGIIQPTLWESEPMVVHMMMRSTEGKIYRSDSRDGGKTWSSAYATTLPNNNSGIDVTKLEDGTLVLVYNPVGINWGPRTPIILSISHDNGITWGEAYTLDEGEGEYSYPAIITKNNELFITYTFDRKSIAFWNIKL